MTRPVSAGRRWRWPLPLILALYLGLATGYGLVNPLFEAPDENWHYFTAQFIARERRLPAVWAGADYDPFLAQEAAQPPLYYLLAAPLVALADTTAARQQVWPNPRVQLGDASAPNNTNAFVHGPWEAWPWQGYALAGHLVRLLSALLGLGTLLCLYGSGRLLWPEQRTRAWLATALVAFLPQFGFHHGAITNDVLVIFLASAGILQLIPLWQRGSSPARLFWLGVTAGLAMLAKSAGILLLLYSLAFVLLHAWQGRLGLRRALLSALWLLGPALLLAGWLLWRNWLLYGDPTASNQFVQIAGGDRAYTLAQVWQETAQLTPSFFAVFGWFNLRGPTWLYRFWALVLLLAAGGVAWQAGKRLAPDGRHPSPVLPLRPGTWLPLLLAGWPLLVYAGMVQFMLRTPAAQGRLLFPAIVPLALGVAWGLEQWPWRRWLWLLPAGALATSLYSLAVTLPRAYALPPLMAASEIPASATPVGVSLGHGLTLVAAQMETASATPGDWVWATLYWRADAPPQPAPGEGRAPEYVALLLGRGFQPVGKSQSYHGGGLFPATLWPLGQVVVERTPVRLDPAMAVPTEVRLNVALAGQESSVTVAATKVVPPVWPPAQNRPLATLGQGVDLALATLPATARPGENLTVAVVWQVWQPPGRDYTTFLHLGDPKRPPLAQGDAPPLDGDYPTHYWAPGERIADQYRLALPAGLAPGRYPVRIGWYDPADGTRLPLLVDGVPQPDNALLLGWVTVGGVP